MAIHNMAVVYKITCLPTKKIYVGWTTLSLGQRWKRHMIQDKPNCYLKNCIKKYGPENFIIEPVSFHECHESAVSTEIKIISDLELNICRFPNGIGMNMTDGGEGTFGYKITDNQRQKLSIAMKGKKKNAKAIENIRKAKLGEKNPMYGKTTSEKQKEIARSRRGEKAPMYGKTGASHPSFGKPGVWKGKKQSAEHQEKKRQSMKGKNTGPRSDEVKEKLRKAQLAYLSKNPHQHLGKKKKQPLL